jgi:cell division septal protein FtsQ
MDRSRRGGTKDAPPASSRLTVRRKQNRKRPQSLWSRMPDRGTVLDACKRTLRRAIPALAATAIAIGIGLGVIAGYRFVTTSQRFAIQTIEIKGAQQLAADGIRQALPVRLGENIFTTDLGDVTRALRTNPWIRSASARRQLPRTLVVEIREHVAVAVVQLGTDLYLADGDGHVFKRADVPAGETEHLPIVTGIGRDDMRLAPRETSELITRALDVINRWRANAMRPDISEVHVDAHHAVTLRMYDRGVAIQLGALRELEARLPTFDAAWTELSDSERARVTALHLDARSDQVTVAFAKD